MIAGMFTSSRKKNPVINPMAVNVDAARQGNRYGYL